MRRQLLQGYLLWSHLSEFECFDRALALVHFILTSLRYKYIFQFPLPIPPVIDPIATYTGPTGAAIDYFEINILPFEKQTYPNLGKTSYVGYNGIAPGPTFHMTKGREAVVRFINKYDKPSSIHLHRSYSRTPFDGWAEDRTYPGEYKDYYYPNAQPMRTLWYHDHSLGITAVNAYFGQAGFYVSLTSLPKDHRLTVN